MVVLNTHISIHVSEKMVEDRGICGGKLKKKLVSANTFQKKKGKKNK